MATNLHVRDSGCVSLLTGEYAQKTLVVLRWTWCYSPLTEICHEIL